MLAVNPAIIFRQVVKHYATDGAPQLNESAEVVIADNAFDEQYLSGLAFTLLKIIIGGMLSGGILAVYFSLKEVYNAYHTVENLDECRRLTLAIFEKLKSPSDEDKPVLFDFGKGVYYQLCQGPDGVDFFQCDQAGNKKNGLLNHVEHFHGYQLSDLLQIVRQTDAISKEFWRSFGTIYSDAKKQDAQSGSEVESADETVLSSVKQTRFAQLYEENFLATSTQKMNPEDFRAGFDYLMHDNFPLVRQDSAGRYTVTNPGGHKMIVGKLIQGKQQAQEFIHTNKGRSFLAPYFDGERFWLLSCKNSRLVCIDPKNGVNLPDVNTFGKINLMWQNPKDQSDSAYYVFYLLWSLLDSHKGNKVAWQSADVWRIAKSELADIKEVFDEAVSHGKAKVLPIAQLPTSPLCKTNAS